MPNLSYTRGVNLERETIKKLVEAGFCASRTAGSHGTFDVFAINETNVKLIQCKTTMKQPTIKMYLNDLRKISNVKIPPNTSKEFHIKYKRKLERILVL